MYRHVDDIEAAFDKLLSMVRRSPHYVQMLRG
jgi:hypothetical protein